MLSRALFIGERLKDGELPKDSSSSTEVSTSSGIMASFPLLRVIDAQLNRHLVHLFQDRGFSLYGPVTGHSPTANIRCGLPAPSSVLLAPPISSPCLDASGGIDLLAVGSLDWLTLRLLRANQMWKGESSKFPMMEGY